MKKILICEDDAISRMMLDIYLCDYFELTFANDGKAAKKLIDDNEYDLILTDISLPYYDGFKILDHIRKEMNSNLPIIIISAHIDKHTREKAVKHGATDYITKPFDSSDLINTINSILNLTN